MKRRVRSLVHMWDIQTGEDGIAEESLVNRLIWWLARGNTSIQNLRHPTTTVEVPFDGAASTRLPPYPPQAMVSPVAHPAKLPQKGTVLFEFNEDAPEVDMARLRESGHIRLPRLFSVKPGKEDDVVSKYGCARVATAVVATKVVATAVVATGVVCFCANCCISNLLIVHRRICCRRTSPGNGLSSSTTKNWIQAIFLLERCASVIMHMHVCTIS